MKSELKPLRLCPAYKDYLWGGRTLIEKFNKTPDTDTLAESWEASCHKDGQTRLESGETLDEYIKKAPTVLGTGCLADTLPVIVKLIDASLDLSLQVHPDDETARALEGGVGKTEMWYVVDSTPNARIYCGLKDGVTREGLHSAIEKGRADGEILSHKSKRGDVFFVDAGTVHAIGAGNLILEVQQCSNITYRLYDWGRVDKNGKSRELHIEKGLLSTKFEGRKRRCTPKVSDGSRLLAACPFFAVYERKIDSAYQGLVDGTSYEINTLVSGEIIINGITLKAGESIFMPAGLGEYTVEGSGTMITTKNSPRFFVGIDLGGTNIVAAVVDENGKIYGRGKTKTHAPRPYNEIFDDMAEVAKKAVEATGITMAEVEAVGIGAPGSINKEDGTIEYSNNLQFFDAPIVEYMERALGKKVYVENDANAAAWGEFLAGAGEGNSMVMITLGTGVGGGIIDNGRLLTGAYGAGAELGHMVIVTDGEECTCGRRGCFEAYASATALVRQTKRAMEENPDSDMWRVVGGDINAVNGQTAFLAKDETAKKVVDRYLGYLAEGVIDVINLLQPHVICIGGGISHEGESILEPLRRAAAERAYSRFSKRTTKITLASLKGDAGLVGAALLWKNEN